MIRFPARRKRSLLTEINMIPLIDVALVLLVIFMILAPVLVRTQMQIRLPEASAGAPIDEERSPIGVEIDVKGSI